MVRDLDRVRLAFDALPLASDARLHRVIAGGRLRHNSEAGVPDLIDELSARLMCSAVQVRPGGATLLVFPDELERRPPILFSTLLIMDALAQIDAGHVGERVLYVSSHTRIRSQLASVRVGKLSLDGVFAQQYGTGRGDELRAVSLPGGVNLPSVLCICAPAEPASLLRQYKPKWVAVDCGESNRITWLPDLLGASLRSGVPVVGWATSPLSDAVAQWLEAGGGLFKWPRLRPGFATQIVALDQLSAGALEADITPKLLAGEHVVEISQALATATEGLLAAHHKQDGRLSTDAVMLGWRYLRAIEALSVPLEVYEREASSYWGIRRLADLRTAFSAFVEAVRSRSPRLHEILQSVLGALSEAHDNLADTEAPLWLGLANICVEATKRRRIVFSSRARRDMFAFCLLARFNISEDDLKDIGVQLSYMTERTNVVEMAEAGDDPGGAADGQPLLVGLPSRFAERNLEGLLKSGDLEILLWPHQEAVLAQRVRRVASEFGVAARGLSRLMPALEKLGELGCDQGVDCRPALRLAQSQMTIAGGLEHDQLRKPRPVDLWKRPDGSDAIASLFGAMPPADDEEGYAAPTLVDDAVTRDEQQAASDNPWVEDALEIRLDGGRWVMLPVEETVNVIVRSPHGAVVEERYVRALRPGDELLFIQGQQRQSLYELLVSRVHRDPVIAQYLALVRRWQDDFVRAFTESERLHRVSLESLLTDLQKKGSVITSPQTVRSWVRRAVLAPNDADDLRRVGELLSLGFVTKHYRQIHRAARRLKGLHINLSARLNRWLASGDAGALAAGDGRDVIDAELGLSIEDFRHSLLRLGVIDVRSQHGPFYRAHLGRLEGGGS